MGEKNIVLGNLFIPGCTIDIHSANALYGAPVYQYFKNTDGQWKSTTFATIEKAVKEEDWDVITMQQGSGSSGMPESFSDLGLLVDCVNKIKPEKTKLMWHMTWAYQADTMDILSAMIVTRQKCITPYARVFKIGGACDKRFRRRYSFGQQQYRTSARAIWATR
ncbi:MAG: DUF4886 domain-containing protein [Eubacteriales bacterium]